MSRLEQIMAVCRCGHAARGHGPLVGDAFHRRCMHCPCDAFDATTAPVP